MPRLKVLPRTPADRLDRHRTAVASTLMWADESAARGDHAQALAWLDVVEAIGDQLVDDYKLKRRGWLSALPRAGSGRRA